MSGTLNFLIRGKETGHNKRIWRNQVWGGTGSSGGSFAQPLLFDTLKRTPYSPEGELDVKDFPWLSQPNLSRKSSPSNINSQIQKSLMAFDQMLDEFESYEDDKKLFVQSPSSSVAPSKNLCDALSRSASRNLFTRRSFQGLMSEDAEDEHHVGLYEAIDDRLNVESGYTTAEHESSTSSQTSNSVTSATSASSGISGVGEKRTRQTHGSIASNFGMTFLNQTAEDHVTDFSHLPPPPPLLDDLEPQPDNAEDQGLVTRESSFDYEAIMRRKKPRTNQSEGGLGLTDYELEKLNRLIHDEGTFDGVGANSRQGQDFDTSDSSLYQSIPDGAEEVAYDHSGVDDDASNEQALYPSTPETYEEKEEEKESHSRTSNPSTLTYTRSILNLPPPPDFTPPPPPNYILPPPPNFVPPPPPQVRREEYNEEEEETFAEADGEVNEFEHLDGIENYTINFQEEEEEGKEEGGPANDDVITEDQYVNQREIPEAIIAEQCDSFTRETPPPPPHDEFPWTAGDDPEDVDGEVSFPAPPLAPPPPSSDWLLPPAPSSDWSPQNSRELPAHISNLEESLQSVQLRRVPEEELSSRSPPCNVMTDAVGMIANMIITGAYKLKPTVAGAAIRRESHSGPGEERNDLDIEQPKVPAPEFRSDDAVYLNASEVANVVSSWEEDKCFPPPPAFPPPFPSSLPLLPLSPPCVLQKPNINKQNHGESTETVKRNHADIDVTQIPGYQQVPSSAAPWRRHMIERKNQLLVEKFLEDKENRKMQEDRWKDVPEWKRNLLMMKERKKEQSPDLQEQFQPKQPPAVFKKSEKVNQWKQRFAQNQ